MKIFVSRNAPNNVNFDDDHIYRRWSGKWSDNKLKQTFQDIKNDYLEASKVNENVVIHTSNVFFLNCFTDEEAQEYFYILNNDGKEIKLFSFEDMQEKLTMMGPGEVVADTIIDDVDGENSLVNRNV